jgi:hypothetical protein
MPRPSRHPHRSAQLPPDGRQIKANKTPLVDFCSGVASSASGRPGVSAGPVGIQPEKVGYRDAAVAAPNASDLAPAGRCDPRGHGFSARRLSRVDRFAEVRSFGVVWGPFRVVRATSGSVFWRAEACGPFLRGASRSHRQVLSGKEVILSSRQVPGLPSCQPQDMAGNAGNRSLCNCGPSAFVLKS